MAAAAFTGVDAQTGIISILNAAGEKYNSVFHLQFGSGAPALLMKSFKEVFDEHLAAKQQSSDTSSTIKSRRGLQELATTRLTCSSATILLGGNIGQPGICWEGQDLGHQRKD